MIVLGRDAASRLSRALAARATVLGGLAVEHGEDWAAVVSRGDAMLPRIAKAVALYEAATGWWFPVGTELAVPPHARDALLTALAERNAIQSAVIVVPRFDPNNDSAAADLYPIGTALPFHASGLAKLAA